MRLGGASIGGIAAASICALALASPAAAGTPGPTVSLGHAGPIEYLKAEFENVVSQTGAPANCEAGDAATGGGGAINGSNESAGLNTTRPTTTDGDGWLAEGKSTGGPRRVDTYAICGTQALGWSSATSPLDAIAQANEAAAFPESCSPGETGFGGIEGDGGDVRIIATHPVAEGWFSFVHNRALAATSATSWHSCTGAYDTKQRLAQPVKVKGDKSGKATAKCKSKETVLSGGVEITSAGQPVKHTWTSATRPWDSKDNKKVPDDGWLVKIHNSTDGKVTLVASALCSKL